MGLQEAYNAEVEAIRSGQLSHPDESKCGCRGGWFLTDFDTWEECPCHRGRRHPEDEPELDPWLCIDIEQADGSPYDGVITYEYDGDKLDVYNHMRWTLTVTKRWLNVFKDLE